MSAVIVKGMEMPEKCGLCDLFHAESPMHCTVVKGHKTVGAPYGIPRPDWCPLVALPDHHGRLVDADALIADCQLAQKQADRHGREFANAFYSGGGEISTEWWCVEDMIENAPTIVEAEGEG